MFLFHFSVAKAFYRKNNPDIVYQTDENKPKYYTKNAPEDRFVKRDIDMASKFLKSHFTDEVDPIRSESVAYGFSEKNLLYETEFSFGEKVGTLTFGRDLDEMVLIEEIEANKVGKCKEIDFIVPLEGRLEETKKFLEDVQSSFKKGENFRFDINHNPRSFWRLRRFVWVKIWLRI